MTWNLYHYAWHERLLKCGRRHGFKETEYKNALEQVVLVVCQLLHDLLADLVHPNRHEGVVTFYHVANLLPDVVRRTC